MAEATQQEPGGGGSPHRPRSWPVLLFLAFVALDLFVLQSGLQGPFVSDDGAYIANNPYIRQLSMENLAAIFDPGSEAQVHAVGNYSPIHLLLHALEWQIFADAPTGYHVVNVLVHALASVLLVALLLRSGVPWTAALVGGAFFTLHPANAQAVVWASQLKSTAGLAFALGALLALPRRRGLATGLFVLGLLTKAAAAFALPAAFAFAWVRGTVRRDRLVLGVWVALFAGYAAVEFAEFSGSGWQEATLYPDAFTHARSVAAYGARYLVMAASSWGVSAYQEPDPALSLLDPWWLLALPLAGLLAWRTAVTLLRREEEGAWWLMAVVSWAPISQVFPFRYPMADHYLYFILPGLIGGSLLLARGALAGLGRSAGRAAAAVAVAVLVLFAWHSSARARLWRSNILLEVDAVAKFPNGRLAHQHAARRAAQRGDVATAVAEMRAARARGLYDFRVLQSDPAFAPIQGDPAFQELVAEWAGAWIESERARGGLTQDDLTLLAAAHLARGEIGEARRALEEGLAVGGANDEALRREIARLRGLERETDGSAAP